MSRTTTIRQFIGSVSETLQDLTPQYFRWGERELVIYANYAQRALAKYLPQSGARIDAIKLTAGAQQDFTVIPASRILPAETGDTYGIAVRDAIRNMGTSGTTPGATIRVVDRRAKDANNPQWHSKTGTSVKEIMYDATTPRVCYVWPASDGTNWVEFSWFAEPSRIPAGGAPGGEIYALAGSNAALMGIHDQYIEDAHNYVVAVALLKGSKNVVNIPKSQHHSALFIASVNAQESAITNKSPNLKTLPFMEEIS